MISNFYYIKKAQFLHFYYSSIFQPIMKLFYDTNAPLRSAQLRPGHLVDALLTSSVRHYACLHAFQWILLGSRDGCCEVNRKLARVSSE